MRHAIVAAATAATPAAATAATAATAAAAATAAWQHRGGRKLHVHEIEREKNIRKSGRWSKGERTSHSLYCSAAAAAILTAELANSYMAKGKGLSLIHI